MPQHATQTSYKKGHIAWSKGLNFVYGIKHEPLFWNISNDLAYLLGVLEGDGYFYDNGRRLILRLRTIDKEFADAFSQTLIRLGFTPHIYNEIPNHKNRQPVWDVRAWGKKVVQFKAFLDSLELKAVFQVKDNIYAYIRGFYDSEGTLYKKTIVMYNATLHRLVLIKDLLYSLGFESGEIKWGCRCYYLRLSSKYTKAFSNIIKPTIPRKIYGGA